MTTKTPPPNYFSNRQPWLNILFAGQPIRAALTAINGVKTVDAWQKQKSKETSGNVAVFQGTQWGDPELIFEAVDASDFDDLWRLWCLLEPVPGQGSSTTPTKSPGQTFAIGSPAAKPSSDGSVLGQVQNAVAEVKNAVNNFKIPNNEPSKVPSPGPRPPTISVQYPLLQWHGITAVARMEWEGPTETETNSLIVKIKLIADKPPQKAGTGAMSPPGSQYAALGGGNAGDAGGGGATGPTDKINKNAGAGAAGV